MAHGLTQKECETEGLFMVIAGSDTTASVVRSTMLHLMSSPRIYNKLKRTIQQTVYKGRASSPITFEQAKKISYLQAVIYEGLRIRAPAPGLYPKTVPSGGDWLHGKFIPAGTAVGMNAAALTRSKTLFGEDADLFRPERFEEVDEATRTKLEHLTELVFGYGRTMCAGKPIAFMELNKVYFEVSVFVGHFVVIDVLGRFRGSTNGVPSSYFVPSTFSWSTPPSHGIVRATPCGLRRTCG